jgi:hypothetical protein
MIQPSRLSDFIASCAPEVIVVRLRESGLLLADASDELVLQLTRDALAQEAKEIAQQGCAWATADTLIAGELSARNLLSNRGRELFADKTGSVHIRGELWGGPR